MLYHLLYPLRDVFFAFNVFRYITFRAAYATVTALLICFVFGPWLIRLLSRVQRDAGVREDVPETHSRKIGTPTMGGLLVIAGVVFPTLLWADVGNPFIQLVLVVTVWTGAIGFWDDWLSVVRKRNKGLVGRYKLLGQLVFGAVLGLFLYLNPLVQEGVTRTAIPFFK
ncbi:MAG TPA: phospho-N-acetylmuramoyl-pentapeptide-transferase, partial [Alphaproteobacteria bacterium]|nr:phospho-N-acetylmuramoyl-pentapeptide-transferase [Alphaproteobacteria bacterium]